MFVPVERHTIPVGAERVPPHGDVRPYRNNALTRPSDVGATAAPDIVIRI